MGVQSVALTELTRGARARGVVRLEAADTSQRSLRVLVQVEERARPRAYTSRSRSELRLDANEIDLQDFDLQ